MALEVFDVLDERGIDYDPMFVVDLVEMLRRRLVTEDEVLELIDQIAFYQDNEDKMTAEYAGKTIAVAKHQVVTGDSLENAVAAAEQVWPDKLYYLVQVPEADEVDARDSMSRRRQALARRRAARAPAAAV